MSATAEQGGGAIGIAALFAVFHTTYLADLYARIDGNGLPPLTQETGSALRDELEAAEQTGLNPATFSPNVFDYLLVARSASDVGYTVTFLTTAAIALIGLVVVARLVRKPAAAADEQPSEPSPA